MRKAPDNVRFDRLKPATPRASAAARGSSRKRDTRCELLLRAALRRLELRYRVAPPQLPGRPDIVFPRQHVAVFCDGDFWHGRNLAERLARLAGGHNAPYWLSKISRNAERDRSHDEALRSSGWVVLRFWETDIKDDADGIALQIRKVVRKRAAQSTIP